MNLPFLTIGFLAIAAVADTASAGGMSSPPPGRAAHTARLLKEAGR